MTGYFFGCIDQGHYLWTRPSVDYPLTHVWGQHPSPWDGCDIDGLAQPGKMSGPQRLGEAVVHHKAGWTLLAFWDRSLDTRPGSNGNFIFAGTHDFAAMLVLAAEHFPEIVARVGPLTEYVP